MALVGVDWLDFSIRISAKSLRSFIHDFGDTKHGKFSKFSKLGMGFSFYSFIGKAVKMPPKVSYPTAKLSIEGRRNEMDSSSREGRGSVTLVRIANSRQFLAKICVLMKLSDRLLIAVRTPLG